MNHFIKRAVLQVSLFLFFILVGCSSSETVAKVGKTELKKENAELLMLDLGYDLNNKEHWRRFIDSWIHSEIMRQELQSRDAQKYQLMSLKAEEYLGNLAAYELEESEILRNLDTVITEQEIKKYFNQNRESFILQDYLVKALYIKTPKGVEVNSDLQKAFLLKNDKDLNKVNSYAKIYAENFYFDDEQWIYFTELTKDIPLGQFNIDNIVLNRTKTYFSDDEFTYFLNILDYQLKNETPPYDFLRPRIREIILTERISKKREELKQTLFAKLRKKYDVSNYYR